MLVLGAEPRDYVVINGNIIVRVLRSNGGIQLAIDAPRSVPIVRGEVYERTNPRPAVLARFDRMDGKAGV